MSAVTGARRVRAGRVLAALLLFVGCAPAEPPHVLLISVDTLRADRLGSYGSGLGLTPHLDALAAASTRFEFAYTTTPLTLPAVASLLTGRHPEELPVLDNRGKLSALEPSLAMRLGAAGWRCGAVVSNFVLRRTSRLDAGFEEYDDRFPQLEKVRGLPERVAPDTSRDALELWDRLSADEDAPVFLWVHYQDPHGPYTAPPAFAAEAGPPPAGVPDRELPASERYIELGQIPPYQVLASLRRSDRYRAAYHAEIRYLDAEIGALFEGLRARGVWERTLVVFVADHGESLGENDYWFGHGRFLTPSETHVPLLVRAPGRAPGVSAEVASLVDVVPTVLALVGQPGDVELSGRDLLARTAADPTRAVYLSNLSERGVERRGIVSEGFLYAQGTTPLGSEEVMTPAAGAPGDARRPPDLRARFEAARARLGVAGAAPEQTLTQEERMYLERLGYLRED